MRRCRGLVLLLAILAPPLGGCGAISANTPPDWACFDVVLHPGGGIPATAGYYGGVAVWSPVGFVLSGLVPYPADEAVAREPGHWLGTAVGLVLGAPFHLAALPFGTAGPPEDPVPDPEAAGPPR